MPEPTPAPAPVVSFQLSHDGIMTFSGSLDTQHKLGAAPNWIAILQVLLAVAPQILQIIQQIINVINPPVPTPGK